MIKISCKILMLLALFGVSSHSNAAGTYAEKAAVAKLLDNVFNAMRAGDDETLKTLILEDTKLDRIAPGQSVTRGVSADWIGWVGTLNPGQADEQIFDVEINVEGPLATAWAPFTIAIDGELKSCGINHFTLVKMNGDWKVAYLIDTHTPEKCLTE
ncbi:MAG: hypothetical protein HOJ34_00375 [Kordiimonadaceae bacterium]|jgi:hypothetical protein|nr:hypothetical protein [Kordiimonadaceae bacterium]MBT6035268.1 hypothetical protein [Kordiimonadaceae bacterium]MBT6328209.1 hypothetical protein [Kordiimonadaceae bacterium]